MKRVFGPTLLNKMLDWGQEKKIKHFFLGSTNKTIEKLTKVIEHDYPSALVCGSISPPFRPLTKEENNTIINKINDTNADIIWVGLGAPKQEKWMYHIIKRLNTKILIGVGAAFDFHAGSKKRAPKWMQSIGLEWLFRLLSEPKRLWRRYLKHNPKFIWYLLLQLLGKKYE